MTTSLPATIAPQLARARAVLERHLSTMLQPSAFFDRLLTVDSSRAATST